MKKRGKMAQRERAGHVPRFLNRERLIETACIAVPEWLENSYVSGTETFDRERSKNGRLGEASLPLEAERKLRNG
jgi:hypothetical protein